MLRRVRKLLLPGIMLLVLAACSKTETIRHDYTFTGESETWSAEYIQTASEKYIIPKNEDKLVEHESSYKYTFELRYKGEASDLDEMKELIFKFQGKRSGGSSNLEGPVRTEDLRRGSSGSGVNERADSVIKVSVDWDGKSEQFELRVDE